MGLGLRVTENSHKRYDTVGETLLNTLKALKFGRPPAEAN